MVPYINYKEMKKFYSVTEVCKLFHVDRAYLKRKCEQYQIMPERNIIGIDGFWRYNLRKLHNLLYLENSGLFH